MAQLEARILRRLLFDFLKPSDYDGDNPFLVSLQGEKYWIYIKNLSPAYFKNPDVWRAQLPIRDIFNECKISPYPFILLGYDDDNDVYTTWNPNFTKQRLNEAESVSFYSRLSLQQEVGEYQEILELTLQNNNKVVCFPRSKALAVITSLDKYFASDSMDYVAIGSKRRPDANSAFHIFTNVQNIEGFYNYLMDKKCYSEPTANNYSQAIKRFITKGIFGKYRTLFLKYDNILEYKNAISEFFAKDDVSKLNASSKRIHSNAFARYLDYLSDNNGKDEDEGKDKSESQVKETQSDYSSYDWEGAYTNKDGKLTKIANPKLLDLLRPVLLTDYPSTNAALNIIYEFYGNKYGQDIMELKDWIDLIRNIDWNSTGQESSQNINSRISNQGGKEYILSVTYPNGKVLKNKNSTTTFLQVIEDSYPDLIMDMNIMVNGINLITKTRVKPRQKEIPSGYFIDVNYKTVHKADLLKNISDQLGLGLVVELIPYEIGSLEPVPSRNKSGIRPEKSQENRTETNMVTSRQKLKVVLPNGRILFSNGVVDTYCDAIKYIGYDKVLKANLFIGQRPVISRYVCPDPTKYRAVDNDFYLHVNTNTNRKYAILSQLEELYSIGLKLELCNADHVDNSKFIINDNRSIGQSPVTSRGLSGKEIVRSTTSSTNKNLDTTHQLKKDIVNKNKSSTNYNPESLSMPSEKDDTIGPKSTIRKNQDANLELSKKDIIRVTFPNGKVICQSNVADTVVEVIKAVGPRRVQQLNLTAHNSESGISLISTKIDPHHKAGVKEVGTGLYVSTCTTTKNKYKTLCRISELLSLDLKVEYLSCAEKRTRKTDNNKFNSPSKVITLDNKSFLNQIRQYEELFNNIRITPEAPHKIILLLSIIDLIDKKQITSTRIDYNKNIDSAFELMWRTYIQRSSNLKCNIALPFYHMNTEPFWSFRMKNPMGFAGTPTSKQLIESKAFAEIPPELLELAKNIAVKERLKKILISKLKQYNRKYFK